MKTKNQYYFKHISEGELFYLLQLWGFDISSILRVKKLGSWEIFPPPDVLLEKIIMVF